MFVHDPTDQFLIKLIKIVCKFTENFYTVCDSYLQRLLTEVEMVRNSL